MSLLRLQSWTRVTRRPLRRRPGLLELENEQSRRVLKQLTLEVLEARLAPASTMLSAPNHRELVYDNTRDLLYITTTNQVLRYRPSTKSFLSPWTVGTSLGGADITPDGQWLYVGEASAASFGTVHKINLNTGAVTDLIFAHSDQWESGVHDLVIMANGKGFLTTDFSGSGWTPLRQLNTANDTFSVRTDINTFPGGIFEGADLSRSGDRSLMTLTQTNISPGSIHTYAAATDTFPTAVGSGNTQGATASFSRDNSQVAFGTWDSSLMDEYVTIRDPQLNILKELRSPVNGGKGWDGGFIFDPVRPLLYVASSNANGTNQIIAIDTTTWVEKYRFAQPGFVITPDPQPTAVSADGHWLFHASGTTSSIAMYDLSAVPAVAINNINATEDFPGATHFVSPPFTLNLDRTSDVPITVDYATADGSAQVGADYVYARGTVTFAPGEISKALPVNVNLDLLEEPAETFFVNLSNPTGLTIVDSQGLITIGESDRPEITIGDVSVVEGNSGSTDAVFTVKLSRAVNRTITVDYATAAGTAAAGADYTSTSGTVTFLAGQTTATVSVAVLGDTLQEADETFFVNLSGATAFLLDSQGRGMIVANDAASAISLSVSDASLTEGNSGQVSLAFTLTLSSASSSTITYSYNTSDVTTLAGLDYSAVSTTQTISPGQTTKTIFVNISGDLLDEADETLLVNLHSIVGAQLSDAQGVATIIDNDTATLAVNDVTTYERADGKGEAVFSVTPVATSEQTISFDYATADMSALAGEDYAPRSGTLTFNPGQTTAQQIVVPILDDALPEADQFFRVNLSNPIIATIQDGVGVATVRDNDIAPTIAVALSGGSVNEGNAGTKTLIFNVTLSWPYGLPVTVQYATQNGTALAGEDYVAAAGTLSFAPDQTQKTISVTINGDIDHEQNENFTMLLSAPTNATIATGSATAGIFNDDSRPTVTINDISVTEGTGGTTDAVFTISLSARSYQSMSVFYSTGAGTATANVDFTGASGTATFNPGETVKQVPIAVAADNLDEANETFFLNLLPVANESIPDRQGQATIVDDDTATLSIADASLTEGDSGTASMNFTVTLSNPMTASTSVSYSTATDFSSSTPATAGTDYTNVSGVLTFLAGQTSKTVAVPIIGDVIDELDEHFRVNLAGASVTITDNSAVGTIVDNDTSTITINDVTLAEGNSGTRTAVFSVVLSTANSRTVSLTYASANVSATAGQDYTAVSGTLNFFAGETTKTISVTVSGDRVDETDETFQINLTSPSNAVLGDGQGIGTITDEDTTPVAVGENYGTLQSTVLTVAAPGVRANDSDADGDGFSLILVSSTTQGGLTLNADGSFVWTPNLNYLGPDSFTYRISDGVNTSSVVTVNLRTLIMFQWGGNVRPVAHAGPSQTVDEGATVTFDASGSSDPDGNTLTYAWTFGDGATGSGAAPTHVYTDNGLYTATLTVYDGRGGADVSTMTVQVNNVAPTVTMAAPASGARGQARAFSIAATDSAPLDQAAALTFHVNWGDGSTQPAIVGPANQELSHTFSAAGAYTVEVTATDKDGGVSATAQHTIVIKPVDLQADILAIGGTAGADDIVVAPADSAGGLSVSINGVAQGTFAPSVQILIYGQAGDDNLQLVSTRIGRTTYYVAVQAALFGAAGDDVLDARGSSASNILVGGAGNDTIVGGAGRDLAIGGQGVDTIGGKGTEDIVIGDQTSYDADLVALNAILAEWARTDANQATRIDHLSGSAGGVNRSYFLNGSTIQDDGASDRLSGGGGNDWFLYRAGGPNRDKLKGVAGGDFETGL